MPRNQVKGKGARKPKPVEKPIRPWRERRPVSKKKEGAELLATRMVKAVGGNGKDSRSPSLNVQKNGSTAMLVKNSVSQIPIAAQCTSESVWYLALGPITRAIEKGWLAGGTFSLSGAQTAYFAWCYLIEAYYSAMEGTFPALQGAPMWFWETAAALSPCSTKFKTGYVQYSWSLPKSLPPIALEYASGVSYFFGSPGNYTVNGFPVLEPVSIPYDPVQGASAVASLFAFMNGDGMTKVGPQPATKFMMDDVSAFASSYVEWGSSATTSGGVASTIQSEVKIQCPIMAKFAQYQQGDGQWRGYQENRKSSGTSSYIIPRAMEFMSTKEFRNKAAPIFKAYNFDEFFLTLSYILCYASERLANDQSTASVPVCKLTSWQVQVLLRQALISRFYNAYAQDLQFWVDQGFTLAPFCKGPNGNTVETFNGMKLPFVFLENIRCATRRTVNVGTESKPLVVDTLPILTRPLFVPQLGNFTYSGRSGPADLYAVQSGEINVNLIDFSYVDNTGKKYITVTGDALANLQAIWNEYIISLGNALSTLGTVGDEPGISALLTTFNTRHIYNTPVDNPVPQPTAQLAKKNSVKSIGSVIPSRKTVGAFPSDPSSSAYLNFSAYALTSTDPFYSPLMRYTSAFVQPCSIGGVRPELSGTLSFQQVFQIEPNRVMYQDIPGQNVLSNAYLTSIDSICKISALLDVKSQLAAESEAEVELKALAETGRGGFMTSLAADIGEKLGIPWVREIADTVGALTGL